MAVNISTLEVPPLRNISPPAKATVKRAITPSTSEVLWSLESTVIAATGRTQATMVATEDVNCSIRCSENVFIVDTLLQAHVDSCDEVLSCPAFAIGRSGSGCGVLLAFRHLRKSTKKDTHSVATQRVRPSTAWPERGTIRSSLFSSGSFGQKRLHRRCSNRRPIEGGFCESNVDVVISSQLCVPGPLIFLSTSFRSLRHFRSALTLRDSALGNAVIWEYCIRASSVKTVQSTILRSKQY